MVGVGGSGRGGEGATAEDRKKPRRKHERGHYTPQKKNVAVRGRLKSLVPNWGREEGGNMCTAHFVCHAKAWLSHVSSTPE